MHARAIFRLLTEPLNADEVAKIDQLNGKLLLGSKKLTTGITSRPGDRLFVIFFDYLEINGNGQTFNFDTASLIKTEGPDANSVILSVDGQHPNLVEGEFDGTSPTLTFSLVISESTGHLTATASNIHIPRTNIKKVQSSIAMELSFSAHVLKLKDTVEYDHDLSVFERLVIGESPKAIKHELNLRMIEVLCLFHKVKRTINNKNLRDGVQKLPDKLTVKDAVTQKHAILEELDNFKLNLII